MQQCTSQLFAAQKMKLERLTNGLITDLMCDLGYSHTHYKSCIFVTRRKN